MLVAYFAISEGAANRSELAPTLATYAAAPPCGSPLDRSSLHFGSRSRTDLVSLRMSLHSFSGVRLFGQVRMKHGRQQRIVTRSHPCILSLFRTPYTFHSSSLRGSLHPRQNGMPSPIQCGGQLTRTWHEYQLTRWVDWLTG